jgi:hypothetical protein
MRIQMFTGFLPLWCGIAQPQHAQKLVSTRDSSIGIFLCWK